VSRGNSISAVAFADGVLPDQVDASTASTSGVSTPAEQSQPVTPWVAVTPGIRDARPPAPPGRVFDDATAATWKSSSSTGRGRIFSNDSAVA
jgi:hypothetical protein